MTSQADDRVNCVVGSGYVGLVTAAGLAEAGREVRVVKSTPASAAVAAGRSPIHEPGLDEVLAACLCSGGLRAVATMAEGVAGAGIAVIVAVGTPPTPDGEADLSQVRQAVDEAVRNAAPRRPCHRHQEHGAPGHGPGSPPRQPSR